ncbi:MAG: histidine--tRNA ligase [bacterium]
MSEFKAVRGVKDILPPETRVWQYAEDTARRLFHKYGLTEIRTPIFEVTPLFVRTIGETTDIVEKEMYTFLDKKGRSLTLRPEGTAGVVRAYLENNLAARDKVAKLYYIGPMFRYERPQAGRLRQFHQIGAEIIGTDNPLADVEIIAVSIDFFKALGLKDLKLYLNNLGCPKCRLSFKKALSGYLAENKAELCEDCQHRMDRNPLRVLDCKQDSKKFKDIPLIADFLCPECRGHFEKVKEQLKIMKINYAIDIHLVRGLDYYTRTVFEIKTESLGAQDAVAAGGRYDNLVHDLGGPQGTGAVGFSLGMERLVMVIQAQGITIPLYKTEVYIISLGEKARECAINILFDLRRRNLTAEMGYEDTSLKAQLRQADKTGAAYAVIIGEEELNKGKLVLRNMKDATQAEVAIDDLVNIVSKKLASQ